MPVPKVSILVPVYGVELYIEKCARSLFEQTYADIEYIFVNDSTKDRSIDILRSVMMQYPERIERVRIIEHVKNLGLAGSRNTAVAEASGEYILHVDSDDYLDENAVAALVRKADSEEADIVVFDMTLQFKMRSALQRSPFSNNKETYLKMLISRQASGTVCGKLIRRDLYAAHHIENPLGADYGEDYCITPRLVFFARKVVYLPEPFYCYVQYNENSYTKFITEKRADGLVMIISSLESFFRDYNVYDRYIEDFNISKLKAKALILYFADRTVQKKYASLYREIPRKEYAQSLGRRDKIVLALGAIGAFAMIRAYRRSYLMAYKVKRTIKPR